MMSPLPHIINFFFPPQCLHCRKEGSWFCPTATKIIDAIPVVVEPLRLKGVDRVVCRGEYDHPLLSTIVQRVKYDYWTGVTGTFPWLLAPLLEKIPSHNTATVIAPVPLHWRRRLARGFNQADYLARALGQITKLPVVPLLRRQRSTKPQARLNESDRKKNITDAFAVRRVAKMPNSVILVDDVITTGSTIRECASVLRQSGVKKIIAVALAKG